MAAVSSWGLCGQGVWPGEMPYKCALSLWSSIMFIKELQYMQISVTTFSFWSDFNISSVKLGLPMPLYN